MNAIFINGEWWLIDTTGGSYKELNTHLRDVSRKDAPEGYKLDKRYNVVLSRKYRANQYFPSNLGSAENYNQKFISEDESNEVLGAIFHFDKKTGVCEIDMIPRYSRRNDSMGCY